MPKLDSAKHPLNASAPRGDGKRYPLVVFLHGNFGLGPPYGALIQAVADGVARQGYVTAVPRYYPDNEPHPTDGDPEPHVLTVAEAIDALAARDDVDPGRLGIVGYSLGAATAMSLIGARPPGWASVFVDFYGPLPGNVASGVAKFPPTAIFHNRLDAAVPFAESSGKLVGMLPEALDVRLSVFTESAPPFNHVFDPKGFAHASSVEETTRWLGLHLAGGGR